ncbi:MAG: CotH kinase family protein [Flavobacteriales bacterium]
MRIFLNHVILLLALLPLSGAAQVVINEFTAANYNDWDVGDEHDWIELYNTGTAAFDLSGHFLSDNMDNPDKWEFPAGTVLNAGEHAVVLCSGLGDTDPYAFGYMNSNFRLRQTGNEEVVFTDPSGTILEVYEFNVIGAVQTDMSWGRNGDGGADWVIYPDPTPNNSNTGPTGTAFAAKPQFNLEAGYYPASIEVEITTPEAGAEIRYTLNGDAPTAASTLYTGPITVANTTVIRSVAIHPDDNILDSFNETNTYFIGADSHVIPVVSVSGDDIGDGSWPWGDGEVCAIEFFDENGVFIDDAEGDSNEHGNDSNAYDQRGFDYITRDQMGYDHAIHHNPFPGYTDRDEYQRFIFKAAANDNYSFANGAHCRDLFCHMISEAGDMKMDERRGSYCIVYLNGEYWGVYDIREKADDLDYTRYYYDQPRGFVDWLKTWGGTWEEYGTGDDWYDLVDFITGNDMTDPANYEYVESQLNTKSLIDYFIFNSYVVSADWLNWNTTWWRGRHPDGDAKRWRYVLWDLDATFGHYVNYTGIPDTGPTADPCDPEGMGDVGGQGHIPVLNALLDNEEFYSTYIARYASYSNTIFSCEYMNTFLDSITGVIAPEMQRQVDLWGGSYAGWEDAIQTMRDFIDDRCADELIGGIEDCYDVEAVTVTVIIDGIGQVEVENALINWDESPWVGTYFTEIGIDFDAFETAGAFLGWEVLEGDVTIEDLLDPSFETTLTGNITIVAHFDTNIDPQLVMYDVQPAGAGDILLDGASTAPHANTILTDGGTRVITAVPNEWYVFDDWDILNATFIPGASDTTGAVFINQTDTIIANFIEIPHFDVMVDVQPAGAGSISIDALDYPDLPWEGTLAGEVDLQFVTTPVDEWSEFQYWMVNNHVVSPDEFSANMVLNLNQTDTIVAVYEVTPHNEITVMIDPPLAGAVKPGDGPIVQDSWTDEVEAGVNHLYVATPTDFWRFTGWSASNHSPTPDNLEPVVNFNFSQNDTIVAHFEKEEFSFYVPNSFSPDSDGINEVWQPVSGAIDADNYEVWVFGRNGEIVFHSTDPNQVWDGSHTGGEHYVQNETYAFRIVVKPVHELEPRTITGHVTLLR